MEQTERQKLKCTRFYALRKLGLVVLARTFWQSVRQSSLLPRPANTALRACFQIMHTSRFRHIQLCTKLLYHNLCAVNSCTTVTCTLPLNVWESSSLCTVLPGKINGSAKSEKDTKQWHCPRGLEISVNQYTIRLVKVKLIKVGSCSQNRGEADGNEMLSQREIHPTTPADGFHQCL